MGDAGLGLVERISALVRIVLGLTAGAIWAAASVYVADHALFWRAERDHLRAEAAAAEQPISNVIDILMIGDSITAGFPLRVELPQAIRAVNAGIGGQTTTEILARLRASDLESFDAVVLQGGTNDIRAAVARGADATAAIEANYRAMIKIAGPQVAIVSVPPETDPFCCPIWS